MPNGSHLNRSETKLDQIKERMQEIRAEIERPHKCGVYCYCKPLSIQLDLLEMLIDKEMLNAKR